jgi:hypothetical protein
MGAFARQLRGQVEFVPNAWGGLTARLSFPTPAGQTAPFGAAPSGSKRNRAAA